MKKKENQIFIVFNSKDDFIKNYLLNIFKIKKL